MLFRRQMGDRVQAGQVLAVLQNFRYELHRVSAGKNGLQGVIRVVYAAGEEWSARSESGAEIPPGERVHVVGQDGLTLIVGTGSPGAMP